MPFEKQEIRARRRFNTSDVFQSSSADWINCTARGESSTATLSNRGRSLRPLVVRSCWPWRLEGLRPHTHTDTHTPCAVRSSHLRRSREKEGKRLDEFRKRVRGAIECERELVDIPTAHDGGTPLFLVLPEGIIKFISHLFLSNSPRHLHDPVGLSSRN